MVTGVFLAIFIRMMLDAASSEAMYEIYQKTTNDL
jgi:hypothetical protein